MSWGIPDVLLDGDVRQAFPFLIPIGIIGLWRWSLFAIRVIFWLFYRPIQPKKNKDGTSANKFKSSDVTIVVPTIDNGDEFLEAVKYWKMNEPYEIIIVTSDEMKDELTRTCESIGPNLFRVFSVPKPNKRVQICAGVNAVKTPIVALSDDDAIWTREFLDWTLAPFDHDHMGGVGSKQIMIPVDLSPTFWEIIADFRLTMRMIETSASTVIDGGMSCISGRTAIYRTDILKDPEFQDEFMNETWRGKHALHSGDDKFITRWLVKNNWNMQMQNHNESCLQTTFKNDSKFLKQVLRWTRNTWRSDIKSIFVDKKILWRHPYVAFNMFDKFINPLPLIWGLVVIIGNLCTNAAATATYVVLPIASWLLLSRTMRLIPHISRKPGHIVYVPIMIAFQYFFVFAKIYALFTLHVTDWGSRPTVAVDENVSKALDGSGRTATIVMDETFAFSPKVSDNRDIELCSSDTDSDTKDCQTREANSESTRRKFVPWYARPAVLIGAIILPAVLGGLVFLGLLASKQRTVYWDVTVLSNQKSLSADRATGGGVYDSKVDKTFIAYAGPNMDPYVVEFDHGAGAVINEIPVARGKEDRDYHDYPRMVMADDDRLVVVYTDSPNTLHMTKCDTPHTTQGIWTDRQINDDKPTYPCLVKVSSGDLFTFYRSTKTTDYRPLHYVKSTDHGETWSKPRSAIDSGGLPINQDVMNVNEVYAGCPRLEPAHDGIPERFAMGWTMAGGGPGVIMHNNYHKDAHFAYFYPSNDTFASVDGQNFGSMIGYEDLKSTVVFDSGPLKEDNKRIVDYYFAASYSDGTWNPMMVFNFNRTLISTKWTGSQWDHLVIMSDAAKNLFDLEKTGSDSFRLFHSQRDILIFTTGNGGKSWIQEHRVEPLEGSVSKVILIPDAHPDMHLIALENDFDLQNSDAPEDQNYLGIYKVWTAKEVALNPISNPSYTHTLMDGVDAGV